MKKMLGLAVLTVLMVGCGGKLKELKETANAVEQLSKSAENVQKTSDEAQTFMKQRQAKGDTVAMTGDEIKKYLPTAIDGYKMKEEPSVQSQSGMGFSYTVASQDWISTSGDTNNPAHIKVTLNDWGGAEGGYAMFYLPMSLNINSEDAHQKSSTVKLDLPYTAGMLNYNKDSKESKFDVATRYRYLISLEASNQTADQSDKLKALALDVAAKFKDK